jgi:hexosaminidase
MFPIFILTLAYSKTRGNQVFIGLALSTTGMLVAFAPFDMFKTTNKNSMGQKIDMESGGGGDGQKVILEHLKPESRKNIVGVEAQVWSETIKGERYGGVLYTPKLVGFAESAWAPERKWETIEDRTKREESIQHD